MINLYKNQGETPLEALDRLRLKQPELAHVPLSYAGRLDPMAEGVMLVLVGEENKDREKYLGLDKEYEVEILFGIETDSYDILGIPHPALKGTPLEARGETLAEFFKNKIGKFNQPYPPYSSKPVNGKPLFMWAREGKLDDIEIPTKVVEIYSLDIISENKITGSDLEKKIITNILKINKKHDFRQDVIINSWEKTLKNHKNAEFSVIKIKVKCSSGTYMRSVAHELGKKLEIGACVLGIIRTQIYC